MRSIAQSWRAVCWSVRENRHPRLCRDRQNPCSIHSGLGTGCSQSSSAPNGGSKETTAVNSTETERAVDFIIDTVMAGDGDITLVPIGPFTNIAAAFTVEPRLAQKAKICMMGGATDRVRPEWNALCDPEATRIVFGTGVPITMVGLDVTTKCVMSYEQVKTIGSVDRPINQICFELIHLWGGDNAEPRPTLHDPLALATLIDPTLCETREMRIEVETRADHLRGSTVPVAGEPNTSVCTSVDATRFMDYFVKTLTA